VVVIVDVVQVKENKTRRLKARQNSGWYVRGNVFFQRYEPSVVQGMHRRFWSSKCGRPGISKDEIGEK